MAACLEEGLNTVPLRPPTDCFSDDSFSTLRTYSNQHHRGMTGEWPSSFSLREPSRHQLMNGSTPLVWPHAFLQLSPWGLALCLENTEETHKYFHVNPFLKIHHLVFPPTNQPPPHTLPTEWAVWSQTRLPQLDSMRFKHHIKVSC